MKTTHALRTAGGIAAIASIIALTTLTACSSSSDGPSVDLTSTSGLPSDAFPGQSASGESVKIGLIANVGGTTISQPESREAAEAVVKYANENLGGLGGRPIEVVSCNSLEEPVSARDCANQMVEAKVPVVVVTGTGFGNIMAPIITGAGIPYVTAIAGSVAEVSADKVYVWTAGSLSSLAMATYAADAGMKNVTAYAIDVPAATGALKSIGGPAFETKGVNLNIVPIPLGTPDATPQVFAGLDTNPEGVIIYGDSTVCISVMKSLAALGSEAENLTTQACADPEVIQSLGSGMDGTKIFSSADTSSDHPESVLYRAIMNTYTPGTPTEGYAVTGYQAMLGFVRATQSVQGTDTSSEALDAAIKSTTDAVLPAAGGLTFTCDGKSAPGYTSICGDGLVTMTMEDSNQVEPSTVGIG
ncbi:ABC transporter substrate-binding protein [Tomitella biformata]|uniref:ABC transporter substrate-binding protein n=1 Tax=Tomitella biformata TaxID=630403 RepID=UPI00046520CD|nr:ABC transporter substrate-binding protein [Tomitella biformata]